MLKWLYYLCVFTLSLGQFGSISKATGINIYLFDLVVGLFFVTGILYFILVKKSFRVPRSYLLILMFLLLALISYLLNLYRYPSSEIIFSAFYLVRLVTYIASGVLIYNMVLTDMISTKQIISSIVLSGLFITFAGFVQLYLLPDFETLDPSLGWDPHKNRLASTFFDPNFTGAYLCIVITLLLDKLLSAKKLLSKESWILMILGVGLLLTFSRSAWLMFSVIILVYGVFRYRLLLIIAVLVGFLAYYSVPRIQTRLSGVTDPADSAQYRIISWNNTWSIAKDNLLIGVGYNNFRQVQKEYGFIDPDNFYDHSSAGSDSSLLLVLATTGVFGLVVYILGIKSIFRPGRHIFGFALFIGLLINSLFINSLFFPQILFITLSLVPDKT